MTELNDAMRRMGMYSPEARAAFLELWRVYDEHYDEIVTATMVGVDDHLAASIRGFRETAAPAAATRELLRDAMLRGRWEPYLDGVRKVGAHYARDDVPFLTWPTTVQTYAHACERHIVAAHAGDTQRVAACLGALNRYVQVTFMAIAAEYLRQRETTISEQRAIWEASAPVLQARPGLLIVPIVGVVDAARVSLLTRELLRTIRTRHARVVVMDVTGVAVVDIGVAAHLLRTVAAARLMGATTVLTGLSASNAETIADLGIDLRAMATAGDLEDGLTVAGRLLPGR